MMFTLEAEHGFLSFILLLTTVQHLMGRLSVATLPVAQLQTHSVEIKHIRKLTACMYEKKVSDEELRLFICFLFICCIESRLRQ